MCGIAGIFRGGEASLQPEDADRLRRMMRLQRHRGPDDEGCTLQANCGLASLRLCILDLSQHGHQPMASDDGQRWLVYNGEVYNYVELRNELRSLGHAFRSDGDTEVVLRAYEQWGDACVERFVGMWAFALFDRRQRRLLLSRDRFGIKPLYYLREGAAIVFASEIKALVDFQRQTGLPVRPSPRSLATYVGTGLVDGLEETFFEGVRRFPAGQNGVATEDGLRTAAYWSLPRAAAERATSLRPDDTHGTLEALHNLLADAVRLHLRSDVPLGVCLSGGLDSSAVVGLAARFVDRVRTFTMWFEGGLDERPFAEQVVRHTGAEAHVRQARAADLLPTLREIVWHLDEPALAPAVYPQWLVMQMASEHVKVVLDGQGGDEVWGGYVPYYTQHLYGLARARRPVAFAREAQGMANRVGHATARAAVRSAVAMTLRPARLGAPIATPDARILAPDLVPLVDRSWNEWRLWPEVFPDDWLNNVLYWELMVNRLPALLRYEDRLSMAFSLESRVPLLDHRLVELSFALPGSWKIRDGWSKWGLRKALEPVLPPAITWRRDKQGFPTPLGRWLRDGLMPEVEDLLLGSGGAARRYLDERALRTVIGQQRADGAELGSTGKPALIWRALNLELWLSRFGLT